MAYETCFKEHFIGVREFFFVVVLKHQICSKYFIINIVKYWAEAHFVFIILN